MPGGRVGETDSVAGYFFGVGVGRFFGRYASPPGGICWAEIRHRTSTAAWHEQSGSKLATLPVLPGCPGAGFYCTENSEEPMFPS